jgi:homoserine O-succinyltransferase/O-acetyltransferase
VPLLVDTGRCGSAAELRGSNCLTLGLVNNMPDAALDATERQFLALVRAATADTIVRFKLFSISEVPRGAETRARMVERYRDVADLWDTRLDGLIVTGTEPRAEALKDEPYWPTLSKLVAWARENTTSTIWSCLAAHAAVLHADGIERRPFKDKLFGIFDGETLAPHPLLIGAPLRLSLPHSRCNNLPEVALAASGYRLLVGSAAVGADTFVRDAPGRSLFVFFQGHPEYEAHTLAREYRRDVGRFLRGEQAHFPKPPQGYFNDAATALVEAFQLRAVGERSERLIADFPMVDIEAGLKNTWRRAAVRIYENWIDWLKDRKAELRASMAPAQRSRVDLVSPIP